MKYRWMMVGILAWAMVLAAQEPGRTLRPQQGGAQTESNAREKRIALVIGNGGYREAPLKNPPSDARAMAQALAACGFKVSLVVDADRAAMFKAVREFGERIRGGGVGLFYYAGHGMQVRGANYLIPVGVDISSEEEVPVQGLDVAAVLGKMDVARNRLNLLILDACRNNPFARSFRSASRGLTQMEAPSGTFVAFATAPGSTASDGEGQNGLYTQHLLTALQQPGLTVEQVFKQVRIGVKRASRDQQVPWDSSSLTGEFYFRAESGSADTSPAILDPAPVTTPVGSMTYLEGTEAEHALMKDAFETQSEYQTRMKTIPPLRVGTVIVDRKNYNLETKRMVLPIQLEPWARPHVTQGRVMVELDRGQAKTLVEDGPSQPLIATFAMVNGQVKRASLTVATSLGPLTTGGSPPVARASRNGSDLWETMVQAGTSSFVLVQVPAGRFEMGPTRGIKPVTISSDFWMGKFEVTQGQWQVVMGSNPSSFKNVGLEAPVEQVSWNDVHQFLARLNGMQSTWTFRLPTEAEWEYACRADSLGEPSEPLDTTAWYKGNSGETTHPVGQKQPNAFGLYDMLGNVSEWCQDWYGDYSYGPSTDPQGPPTGQDRVMRGGSWDWEPTMIRSTHRGRGAQDMRRYVGLGFRVVAAVRTP